MASYQDLDHLATTQYGVVTYEQLIEAGFTDHQIRYRLKQGLLRPIHRRVYALAGSASTPDQRACAASLAALPLGALSHRAAAHRWKFRTIDTETDVVVRYPRRLTLKGVTVHRSRDLEQGDITWVDGIATTTPERTIGDLGLIFPDAEVLRILDHAIATALVSRQDMQRLRERIGKQGRDGAGTLERVLADVPAGAEAAESGAEVMFLRMCEMTGTPIPVMQLPVVVAGHSFRVDFAYPLHRIFIEIDGKATHEGITQIANDGGRQNLLVANGWTPIRFMYRELKTSPEWCASVVRDVMTSVNQNRAYFAA